MLRNALLALAAAYTASAQETCTDLTGDGFVNVDDLLALLASYGTSAAGDVTGDAVTNVDDLLLLLSSYGTTCEAPSSPVDPGDATECPADQAGYVFTGPAFVDISTTGTAITDWGQNPDDGFFEVPLPFVMPWYGRDENIIHVGTNGYITFGSEHF
eukprot:COSAG02_NODE_34577_length_482_cov_0.582245_1_plen_156_part_10